MASDAIAAASQTGDHTVGGARAVHGGGATVDVGGGMANGGGGAVSAGSGVRGLIRIVSARTSTVAAHVAAVVVVQEVGKRAIRLCDAEHLKPARRHSGLRHVH